MKTCKSLKTHKGFFDLGIGLGLLALFGFTTAAVNTNGAKEIYQEPRCYEEYNLDNVCEDSDI